MLCLLGKGHRSACQVVNGPLHPHRPPCCTAPPFPCPWPPLPPRQPKPAKNPASALLRPHLVARRRVDFGACLLVPGHSVRRHPVHEPEVAAVGAVPRMHRERGIPLRPQLPEPGHRHDHAGGGAQIQSLHPHRAHHVLQYRRARSGWGFGVRVGDWGWGLRSGLGFFAGAGGGGDWGGTGHDACTQRSSHAAASRGMERRGVEARRDERTGEGGEMAAHRRLSSNPEARARARRPATRPIQHSGRRRTGAISS